MTRLPCLALAAALLLPLLLATPTAAQWPADPSVNLPIADRMSEQVTPKIASAPNSDTYVAWFDLAAGSYDVYLQRLNSAGVEQWPHNGILVSDHPQNTSLVDWDLIADSAGNCVLVFSDVRGAGDLDVQAYKIAPDGTFLWGASGITLSVSTDPEPAPYVAEASDGDFVFVWPRWPNSGGGNIMMQRLAPDGTLRYPAPLPIAGDPNEQPAFAAIVAADAGSVIASWVRDVTTFSSSRHVRARKFAPDASPLWPAHVNVFDAASVPIAYTPKLEPDGAGGTLVLWHRSQSNLYNSLVQHLSASGTELFPHNGVEVATTAMHHIDPALAYRQATGECFIFWNERNSLQSQWGIYAQKITAAGARAWGDAGRELQPVNTIYKSYPRCVQIGDGAAVFYYEEPTGQFNRDRLLGIRIDASGALVWPTTPLVVSSYLSSKARIPLTIDAAGVTKIVWEDDRSGTPDIYGQNVNPDGTLGPSQTAIGGQEPAASVALLILPNRPNPFRGLTELGIAAGTALGGNAAFVIADAAGRIVRTIEVPGRASAGARIAWDGRNDQGAPLPSGTYFDRLVTPAGESAPQKATRLR